VRQVGCLQRLYRDARSTEHKIILHIYSKLFELSDPYNTTCGTIMADEVSKVSEHIWRTFDRFLVMYPQQTDRQTDRQTGSWMHRAEKHLNACTGLVLW